MINKTLDLLLSILLFLSLDVFSQASQEVDKNKDGIVVYTRAENGPAFKSFKAVATRKALTDEVINVLKNANGYTQTTQ